VTETVVVCWRASRLTIVAIRCGGRSSRRRLAHTNARRVTADHATPASLDSDRCRRHRGHCGWATGNAPPSAPYNLSSLLLDDGGMAASLVFAMALLWLGAGPRCWADGWLEADTVSRAAARARPARDGQPHAAQVQRYVREPRRHPRSNVYAGELAGWLNVGFVSSRSTRRSPRCLRLHSWRVRRVTTGLSIGHARSGRGGCNRGRVALGQQAGRHRLGWHDNLTELIATRTAFATSGFRSSS